MIKVIKNADVYAPEHLGARDILICDEKICAVAKGLDIGPLNGLAEVIDLHGAAVGPGYIDGHVHVTGGGGEQGPGSRVPECRVSELVSCGVTTVLALLGTDCISRSLENVLAKTRALIRRGRGTEDAGLLSWGAITLNTRSRLCRAGGRDIKLSPREYDLLLCLMRNRGQVLTRAQLLDKVWGLDFEGDDRAVDVRVRSLRAALGEAGKQIKTVFKAGYKLEEV